MSVFSKFKSETKVVKVKALGGEEVTIREMSYKESVDFSKRLFKGMGDDGQPIFEPSEFLSIKAEKVASCMVEPKMSIKELLALPASAGEAINEIAEAIDSFSGKK